jgi:hypothetical protein
MQHNSEVYITDCIVYDMMAEADRWSIDKLESANWMTWKFQMKHLLLAEELWGFIDGTEVLPNTPTAEQEAEFKKKAQKAFSTIVMLISSPQLNLVTSCENPADAWKALQDHFEL